MKYLFILGRNEGLSIFEIKEYLKTVGNPVIKYSHEKNGLLIEVNSEIQSNLVDILGGTLAIGKVIATGNKGEIFNELEKTMIYSGTKNKLTYTLWEFSSYDEKIKEYLKQRFKEEKLKTSYKGLTGFVESQSGEKESKPSSKLIEEEYFIFEEENMQYFGIIFQKCDYEKIEQREVNKPVKRPSLDISPRLAKILINLCGIKENEKLYDPFCGIGVILQEALIRNINVIGSDIDTSAIKGANENLNWFNFPKEKYELIKGDSSKIEIPNCIAIATEPDLGITLKKIPTKEKANNMLNNFEKLMISVINNVQNKISGRIVFTSPNIRIGKKRISCNIEKICERTNFKLCGEGIAEHRGNQIVGRMIYVLEKC